MFIFDPKLYASMPREYYAEFRTLEGSYLYFTLTPLALSCLVDPRLSSDLLHRVTHALEEGQLFAGAALAQFFLFSQAGMRDIELLKKVSAGLGVESGLDFTYEVWTVPQRQFFESQNYVLMREEEIGCLDVIAATFTRP